MNLPLDGKYQTQVFTELFHQETFGCNAYEPISPLLKRILKKDVPKTNQCQLLMIWFGLQLCSLTDPEQPKLCT